MVGVATCSIVGMTRIRCGTVDVFDRESLRYSGYMYACGSQEYVLGKIDTLCFPAVGAPLRLGLSCITPRASVDWRCMRRALKRVYVTPVR